MKITELNLEELSSKTIGHHVSNVGTAFNIVEEGKDAGLKK